MGLHFEISDVSRLWWGVWALWAWSFVCCIQQLYSLRPYIEFPGERRVRIVLSLQRPIARLIIWRAVRESFRRQVTSENRVAYLVGVATMQKRGQEEYAQAPVEVRWRNTPEQSRAVRLVDDAAVRGRALIAQSTGDGRTEDVIYHRGAVTISRPAPRVLQVLATVWLWMFTSLATDYVLPVVVGLSPLVIKIAGYEA